jgi:mRNA-degrading endonuclease RelE of RelBE toxin-antitoxin system
MTSAYRVLSTPPFERSVRRLTRKNRHVADAIGDMIAVLEVDPLNASRRHHIKKLTNIEEGEGQWRIRSGVYRLRYDVVGHDVVLYAVNHRKEAY